MLTDGRTDGHTDGRKVITIAHPEHSSGELKNKGHLFFHKESIYEISRNQYMKFQNISIHGSKLILYTIKQQH